MSLHALVWYPLLKQFDSHQYFNQFLATPYLN